MRLFFLPCDISWIPIPEKISEKPSSIDLLCTALYCRVSTNSNEQYTSYETQKAVYGTAPEDKVHRRGKEYNMEVQKIILESIRKTNKEQTGKLRVAAYCRVSTDTEDQKTSFEGQVKHYTELIGANPEWEMAGIFADEGITGTSAAKRPQFQAMMRVCEEGKIDLKLVRLERFDPETMEEFYLTPETRLTEEQIRQLEESEKMPIMIDDECPESTPEQLERFRKFGQERNKRRAEMERAKLAK